MEATLTPSGPHRTGEGGLGRVIKEIGEVAAAIGVRGTEHEPSSSDHSKEA
jgi:hypothetical protein